MKTWGHVAFTLNGQRPSTCTPHSAGPCKSRGHCCVCHGESGVQRGGSSEGTLHLQCFGRDSREPPHCANTRRWQHEHMVIFADLTGWHGIVLLGSSLWHSARVLQLTTGRKMQTTRGPNAHHSSAQGQLSGFGLSLLHAVTFHACGSPFSHQKQMD